MTLERALSAKARQEKILVANPSPHRCYWAQGQIVDIQPGTKQMMAVVNWMKPPTNGKPQTLVALARLKTVDDVLGRPTCSVN